MNINENISYLKYFGVELTFWKTLNRVFDKNCKFKKLAWKVHDKNNNIIEKYLKKVCPKSYAKLVNGDYDDIDQSTIPDLSLNNNVIWTMWWQGEEKAPEIVKVCINSMRKHSNGHKVIVLDAENYTNYVKLPQIIVERLKEGELDKTNLRNITLDQTQVSDIVRTYLMYNYGGIWADATMFFSRDIDNELFEEKWVTLGQDNQWYIGRGRWSTFFMGGTAGLGFAKFNYDMHIEYWENKQYYVNYLMTDHMFDLACKERERIENLVENNPCLYRHCLTVSRRRNQVVNEKEAEQFFENQIFHKLSWRWWGREKGTKIKLQDNQMTWFDYLIKNYSDLY